MSFVLRELVTQRRKYVLFQHFRSCTLTPLQVHSTLLWECYVRKCACTDSPRVLSSQTVTSSELGFDFLIRHPRFSTRITYFPRESHIFRAPDFLCESEISYEFHIFVRIANPRFSTQILDIMSFSWRLPQVIFIIWQHVCAFRGVFFQRIGGHFSWRTFLLQCFLKEHCCCI